MWMGTWTAAYCRPGGNAGDGAWRKAPLLAPGSNPKQTAVLCLTQEKDASKRALYSSKFARETATCDAAVHSR